MGIVLGQEFDPDLIQTFTVAIWHLVAKFGQHYFDALAWFILKIGSYVLGKVLLEYLIIGLISARSYIYIELSVSKVLGDAKLICECGQQCTVLLALYQGRDNFGTYDFGSSDFIINCSFVFDDVK